MVTPSLNRILGLFPWFGPDSTGGAQVSGRLGWEGLKREMTRHSGGAQLFCYDSATNGQAPKTGQDTFVAHSKLDAVWQALSRQWHPDVILIWHLSLLKLLPFFRADAAQVVLMLLGIEAWRRHDPLTRLLLRHVDTFLSISDHTWHRFLDFYPELATKPHHTVYLGINQPTNKPTHQQTNPPTNQPTAFILSRLSKGEDYKGHRELIAAWPWVLRRIPNARLWIAGEGDLRPDLERMVHELALQDHIHFWGWITEEKKQELLQQCRCFAMPSRGEGFGLVYLEAMRLGRPCLVSTLDAGREVVNPPEAGLAVDPRDTQALADAVCRLLTPGSEWDRWSRRARERYETQFTARHFQKRLVSALFPEPEKTDALRNLSS